MLTSETFFKKSFAYEFEGEFTELWSMVKEHTSETKRGNLIRLHGTGASATETKKEEILIIRGLSEQH